MTRSDSEPRRSFYLLGTLTLSGALLYWGQPVLIPVTIAVLAAFLLAPVVDRLEGWRNPRFFASSATVVGAAIVLLGVADVFVSQVQSLASDLPNYRKQIKQKVAHLREVSAETWIVPVVDFANDLTKPDGENSVGEAVATKMEIPVFPIVRSVAGAALDILAGFILVLVLALLMLLRREDLRNRLIHFLGPDRLVSATRAIDDAGKRVSRFLLFQFVLNLGFGIVVAIGLYFIGIPYAYIWGALAALLRYIPFLGGWIAAAFPLLASLGLPGWTPFFLTATFLGVVELVQANLMEPLIFGHSIGVSGAGQLIAALFWGCLWGPMGLILSTPLTACLCVLGRHFTVLRFFSALMGDEDVVEKPVAFYQRLLAGDTSEAMDVAEDYLKDHSGQEAEDELLLLALMSARNDQEHGELTREDSQSIVEAVRDIVEVVAPPDNRQEAAAPEEPNQEADVLAVEFPFNDDIDALVVHMLRRTAASNGQHWSSVTARSGRLEGVSLLENPGPAVILLATSARKNLVRLRGACKAAHGLFPDSKIVVGIWSLDNDLGAICTKLKESGASAVCSTMAQAHRAIAAIIAGRAGVAA